MQQTDEIHEEYDGPAINHSSVMTHGTAASSTILKEKSLKKYICDIGSVRIQCSTGRCVTASVPTIKTLGFIEMNYCGLFS
jgi:hypothetical protein